MKYSELTLGTVEAVVNKLGGMEGVQAFLRDELVLTKKTGQTFPLRHTIKLGTEETTDALKESLKKAGCDVSDWANDIMNQPTFTLSKSENELDLVVFSLADLGFIGARYKNICEKAKELGLQLCPLEVGPQLRLQYADQPKGEWLIIAMEPIAVSGGDLGVFGVGRGDDGEQWLNGHYGHPGSFWRSNYRFVFVRSK
ncbi:MAG: hypothetical protein WC519_02700 [Parcubacteria group bacterium]